MKSGNMAKNVLNVASLYSQFTLKNIKEEKMKTNDKIVVALSHSHSTLRLRKDCGLVFIQKKFKLTSNMFIYI